MSNTPAIVWFRRDLRLSDNPALNAAIKTGKPILPVYIHDESNGARPIGGASRWWLHQSLASLKEALDNHLVILEGPAEKVLQKLIENTKAEDIFWNRYYEPFSIARDKKIKEALLKKGLNAKSFNASLLFEPASVKTKSQTPFKVFTAFWKACRAQPEPDAPTRHEKIKSFYTYKGIKLDDLNLLPTHPDWSGPIAKSWSAGEKAAHKQLQKFLEDGLAHYKKGRDVPSIEATSRLSPYLHFGEISPRQIWHAAKHYYEAHGKSISSENLWHFFSELGWREFSYQLLYFWPDLPTQNWRKDFDAFPWQKNKKHLRAWQMGQTGYPIVDAGMRQLWQTGWMHNRVRMICASFLIKHLLIDWRVGEEWFWDTLVDADPANNAASWQWVAGCGADAAPYFRIFNPILQGDRFDPDGDYVKKFVPELKNLNSKFIHRPWEAPAEDLAAAKITLGKTYPHPIVDHDEARQKALAAYKKLK